MKGVIQKPVRESKGPGNTWAREGSRWKDRTWLLIFLAFGLGAWQKAAAQIQAPCSIVCLADDPSIPVLLRLDDSCKVTIYATSFIFSQSCPSDKALIVRDEFGVVVAQGQNQLRVDLSGRVGQLFTVTVVDLGTGLTCVGYARVVDETPPQIMCRDTLLPCSADTSVAALGMPLILENCDTAFSIKRSDRVDFRSCASDTSAIIYRTWIARDRYGNADTCVQQITLLRATLADVVFPADTTLECSAPSTHPDSTGYPRWSNLQLLYGGGLCRFSVTHRDVVTSTCGNGIGRIIDRIWSVEDLCNGGQVRTHTQTITVADTKPPVIVCPPAKTVRTTVGECTATVLLDKPVSVQDACDPDAMFVVSASFGKVGLGPHYYVPTGIHQITYTALDACGNASVCYTTLTVKDEERPIAICDDEVVISLNETGTAVAAARVFDEGSKDNCVKTLYYKVRRMDIGGCDSLNGDDSAIAGYQEWFDDVVFFCCEDVGQPLIPVILRVYTVNPGPGPIDPAREAEGGDLFGKFNECMSMVRIKDPIPPAVFCPEDVTVECTEDLTDLSRFGSPVIFSGCGYTLDSTVVSNIDNCGRGTIKRIFTVTGKNGLTTMCMQTITVINTQSLTEKDITWPKDISLNTCGANTDPDFLPVGYRRPQLARQPACGLSAIMHEDKLYDAAPPACFKVFRTWTIIDWCVYDPAKSPTVGRYQHTQIIKVEDNQAPNFVCPPDMVVAAVNGCASAQVTLPALVATDCSPNVTIVNDSRYAASPGANISGVYPLGTTVVTYKISDGCGNVATCKVRITVEDQKAPGVVCYHGLSTSIAQMPGGIMAMVDAKAFDAGSTDNCTDTTNLRFTIRRASLNPTIPPTATQLTFDCADVGIQGIEVWATDESGNSAYCLTTILITDNGQLCPPDVGLGVVAGEIKTEGGNNVEKVKISVMSDKPMYAATNVNGGFLVDDIPFGHDYTLVPEKNDDLMNGISTIDLIRLSKHILGVQPFTSPYQWIAADLDKSGTISTLDLIKLRKLILNKDTDLPNGNTSWRFVDADYKFPETGNPLQVPFPEVKNINNFRQKDVKANFIAVKVGDINGSAIANQLMSSESRTTGGDMVVRAKDRQFSAGETFTVDFYSADLQQVNGYQFTLDFDERLLELKGLEMGDVAEMSEENFGFGALSMGKVLTSWNKGGASISQGDLVLFSLTFQAKRSADLATALKLNDRPATPEAYNADNELMQVLLHIEGEDGKPAAGGGYLLYQNVPNPFQDATTIGFILPGKEEASLRIYDLAGRLVYQRRALFEKGYNEIQVDRGALHGNGMYYYQLSTEAFTETRKMMLGGSR